MSSRLWVMVLAGGRGERLWPLSTSARPKPFLRLLDGASLIRRTLERATRVAPVTRVRIIAGSGFLPAIRKDLGDSWSRKTLREPAPRNTGAACLFAARWVQKRDPGGIMLVLPSDHRVEGAGAFRRAVERARALAGRGFLVTFGVPPAGPSGEFGYLVPGEALGRAGRRVLRFVEKPAAGVAARLLRQGALWNSGMFVWKASTFLEEAERCEPSYRRWLRSKRPRTSQASEARDYARLADLSVDRAVMERSRRVATVRAGFRWSDLGSWACLRDLAATDRLGNTAWGSHAAIAARDNLVFSDTGLSVIWGVEDLLVVRAEKVLLVCPRARFREMRGLLRELRRRGWGEYL